jgi:hypothetical protein
MRRRRKRRIVAREKRFKGRKRRSREETENKFVGCDASWQHFPWTAMSVHVLKLWPLI